MWLQLLTAAFAIALAWLNKEPVKLMRAYWTQGSHTRQERSFHAANGAVKVLWVVLAVSEPARWFTKALTGLLLLLILWLVFDIALNLFTGKKWDYLGKTAALDRLVRNGKVKAVACAVLIAALNVFLSRV